MLPTQMLPTKGIFANFAILLEIRENKFLLTCVCVCVSELYEYVFVCVSVYIYI